MYGDRLFAPDLVWRYCRSESVGTERYRSETALLRSLIKVDEKLLRHWAFRHNFRSMCAAEKSAGATHFFFVAREVPAECALVVYSRPETRDWCARSFFALERDGADYVYCDGIGDSEMAALSQLVRELSALEELPGLASYLHDISAFAIRQHAARACEELMRLQQMSQLLKKKYSQVVGEIEVARRRYHLDALQDEEGACDDLYPLFFDYALLVLRVWRSEDGWRAEVPPLVRTNIGHVSVISAISALGSMRLERARMRNLLYHYFLNEGCGIIDTYGSLRSL